MADKITPEQIGAYLNAWQKTLAVAAQDNNFKDGAFREKVDHSTNIIDGIRTFMTSRLLSKEERAVFVTMWVTVYKLLTRSPQMNKLDMVLDMATFSKKVDEIFAEDRRQQALKNEDKGGHVEGGTNTEAKSVEP